MADSLTPDEISEWTQRIEQMPHIEMCRLWRFAPAGHPAFTHRLVDIFMERYLNFGGMTPEMSKAIELKC